MVSKLKIIHLQHELSAVFGRIMYKSLEGSLDSRLRPNEISPLSRKLSLKRQDTALSAQMYNKSCKMHNK